MRKLFYTLAICLFAVAFTACKNDNKEIPTPDKEKIEFPDETIPKKARTEAAADISFNIQIDDSTTPWVLPITKGFEGTVTWGDDTEEKLVEDMTHTFGMDGLYTVTISSLSGNHTIHLDDVNSIEELTIYKD